MSDEKSKSEIAAEGSTDELQGKQKNTGNTEEKKSVKPSSTKKSTAKGAGTSSENKKNESATSKEEALEKARILKERVRESLSSTRSRANAKAASESTVSRKGEAKKEEPKVATKKESALDNVKEIKVVSNASSGAKKAQSNAAQTEQIPESEVKAPINTEVEKIDSAKKEEPKKHSEDTKAKKTYAATKSPRKTAALKTKTTPIPTARNEAAKDSAPWYDPLASSIFSRPIFNYPDEPAVSENTSPPPHPEEPIEIRNESLEMLLDLKIDDDDADFEILEQQDTSATEFGTGIFSAMNTADGGEEALFKSGTEAQQEIMGALAETVEATDAEETEPKETNEGGIQNDNSAPASEENSEVSDEATSEESEISNSDADAPSESEQSALADGENAEEGKSPAPEENSEDEKELPPLMDIDHFSDYRSKNEPEDDGEQFAFIAGDESDEQSESDNPESEDAASDVESEDGIAKDEENELEVTDELLSADSEGEFQRSFFEQERAHISAPTAEISTKKELNAEPLTSPDEIAYDPKKPRKIDFRFDFVELFVFTLVIIMVLTTFVFRHSIVEGTSMEGTLQNGDHLILYDLFYSPSQGDIIVFEDYSTEHRKPLVKRVIATEGQTVKIDIYGNVFVDGVKLEEDYVYIDGFDSITRPLVCTVPKGEVFVMGDHRNNSADSRTFGTVKVDSILGKAVLRFLPISEFGTID